MNCYFNKICQGSLLTISMILSGVSICAVVLVIKHANKANKLSNDVSKHSTQRTVAQNITFTISQELEKLAKSNGNSAKPFITTFVNNNDPAVVGSRSETPTDSSALNITVIQQDDQSNNINDSANFRGRVTSTDSTKRSKLGYHTNIINKAIPSSTSGSTSAAPQTAGGYAIQVQKVYPDPSDTTNPDPADSTKKASVIYALLVKSYACNDGNPTIGSCSSSSILGDYSFVIFKKRTCPVINGTQLIVANDPGKDLYNLNCTCPTGKTIQADGTCVLRCGAGKFNNSGTCEACAAGKWSSAGSTSCTDCSGCGTGFGTCDPTQGCTSCPAGKKLVGNSCVFCDAGTAAASGANVCTVCAAGQYALAGASSCQSCTSAIITSCDSRTGAVTGCSTALGYKLQGGACVLSCPSNCQSCSSSTVCTICNSGWYLQADNTCAQSCPSGTYQVNNSSGASCVSCSAGTWAAAGSNTCSSCLTTGAATCDKNTGSVTSCLPGYGFSSGTCTACINGTSWSSGGTSSCQKCYWGAVTGTCTAANGNRCADNAVPSTQPYQEYICNCVSGYIYVSHLSNVGCFVDYCLPLINQGASRVGIGLIEQGANGGATSVSGCYCFAARVWNNTKKQCHVPCTNTTYPTYCSGQAYLVDLMNMGLVNDCFNCTNPNFSPAQLNTFATRLGTTNMCRSQTNSAVVIKASDCFPPD